MYLRVALAQLNTVVGDLPGNVERIVAALRSAEAAGADLCVFPEMTVTGYPPEDLLLKPGFVADNVAALGGGRFGPTSTVAVVRLRRATRRTRGGDRGAPRPAWPTPPRCAPGVRPRHLPQAPAPQLQRL